jgi:hypothetical protein
LDKKEGNMKETKALRALVDEVFGDEKAKAEFIADPKNVMSRFNLTEVEKRAVLAVYAKMGLVTADSTQLDTEIGPMNLWN